MQKEGEFTLHSRAILEMEQYIRETYPDAVKICNICHSLLIQVPYWPAWRVTRGPPLGFVRGQHARAYLPSPGPSALGRGSQRPRVARVILAPAWERLAVGTAAVLLCAASLPGLPCGRASAGRLGFFPDSSLSRAVSCAPGASLHSSPGTDALGWLSGRAISGTADTFS